MGKKRNKVEIFKLEDRVLFEAGAVVQAAEAAAADQANNDGSAAAEMQSDNSQTASDELTPDTLAEMPVPPEMSGSDNADDASAADFAAADPESETVAFADAPIAVSETSERILVVLNSSVADAGSIVNDLGDNVEVLHLEAGTDALDTINDYLDEHADTKYSAIHLVSHGSEGYITLNGEKIDSTTINPADWKAIGEHLTDDADILVYGCDTAKSDEGKALVQTIANLTGADVAASIDSTGANGNWDLEYRSGLIEAATIKPVSYQYDLPATTITVTTLKDVVDAEDGVTSLREAITEANTNGGEYTISFDQNLAKVDTNGDGTADVYQINLTSTLSISKSGLNLTIDGMIGTDRVILDGGDTYGQTVDGAEVTTHSGVQIMSVGSGTTVVVDGLRFQNGYKSNSAGAILNAGNLTVTNSAFLHNTGNARGVAVFNSSASARLIFDSSYMDGNISTAGDQGAIGNNKGTVIVTNSTIVNTVNSRGFREQEAGNTFFFNSTITGNSGGGIHSVGGYVVNCIVSGNGGNDLNAPLTGKINAFGTFYSKDNGYVNKKYGATKATASMTDLFGMASATLSEDGTLTPVLEAAKGKALLLRVENTAVETDDGSGNITTTYRPDLQYSANDGETWTTIQQNTKVTRDVIALLDHDQVGHSRGTKTIGAVSLKEDPSIHTLVVNTTNGLDEYDGKTSIEEAIAYANTLTGTQTVTFAQDLAKNYDADGDGENDTYLVNLNKSMTVNKSGLTLTIDGSIGEDKVTLDAGGKFRHFTFSNAAITLQDMTLQNGAVAGNGGAISNSGTLTVDNVAFYDNAVTNNSKGGAIYTSGGLTVRNSEFIGNTTTGTDHNAQGGAIYAKAGMTVYDSLFQNNISRHNGGAITGDGTIRVYDSEFITNKSTNSSGGAIYVSTTLIVDGSYFDGNSAASRGAGIDVESGGNALISDSTFVNHGAKAAVYAFASGAGKTVNATIINSTFLKNTLDVMHWNHSSGSVHLKIYNSVLAGTTGLKLYTDLTDTSSVDVKNTIYTVSTIFTPSASDGNIKATVSEIFGAEKPTLDENHTIAPILEAAKDGAGMLQVVTTQVDETTTRKDLQYSSDGGTTWTTVQTSTLANNDILATDQLGNARTGSSIGAVSLAATPEPEPTTTEVTLKWDLAESGYTYNGADQFVTVTLVDGEGNAVNGIEVVLKYNDAAAMHNAGSYTITVDANALNTALGTEYVLADGAVTTQTVEVQQKTITISNIAAANKEYNGLTDAAVTFGKDGILDVDADKVTLTVSGTFADQNVGTDKKVDLVWNLSGDASANYKLSGNVADTTADITAKEVTLDWTADNSYIYNGKDQSGTVEATYTDVNGEVQDVAISFNEVFKNAGTYTATAGSVANYTFTNATQSLTIGKATVTVTADNQTITEGNEDPTLTYMVEGLADGDVFTGTLVRAEGTGPGTYAITLAEGYTILNGEADMSGNYTLNYVGANLTIEAAAEPGLTQVTLEWTVGDYTYDGENHTVEVKVVAGSTVIDTINVALTYTFGETTVDAMRNAGEYTITVDAAALEAALGTEYVLAAGTELEKTVEMQQKVITVTAHAKSMMAGTLEPALTYTVEGLIGTDTLTGALEREAGTEAGEYDIKIGTLKDESGNYKINFTGAKFTITERVVDAAALVVTTTDDVVDAEDGKVSLREAIEYAVSIGGGTITFAAGKDWESMGTITLDSTIAVSTDLAGAITIDGSYTKADGSDGRINIVNGYTLNAKGQKVYQNIYLFNVKDTATATASSFTLKNLTFDGLNYTSVAGVVAGTGLTLNMDHVAISNAVVKSTNIFNGNSNATVGFVYIQSGTLNLTDSVFENNTFTLQQTMSSGVLVTAHKSSTVLMENVKFLDNSMTGTRALANAGTMMVYIADASPSVTLRDVEFSGNKALVTDAAKVQTGVSILDVRTPAVTVERMTAENNTSYNSAFYFKSSGELRDSTFRNNTVTSGSTIETDAYSTGYLKIVNTLFEGNSGKDGGAVNGGHLDITDSAFINNTATGNGGALRISITGSSNVKNSTFFGNSAANGGAICISSNVTNTTAFVLTNLTIAGNTATGYGGGIYAWDSSTSNTSPSFNVMIGNSIILGNKAGADQHAEDYAFQADNQVPTNKLSAAANSIIGAVAHVGVDGQTSVRNPLVNAYDTSIIVQARNVALNDTQDGYIYSADNVLTLDTEHTIDNLITTIFGSRIRLNADGRSVRTFAVEGLTLAGERTAIFHHSGNSEFNKASDATLYVRDTANDTWIVISDGKLSKNASVATTTTATSGNVEITKDQYGLDRTFEILWPDANGVPVNTTFTAMGATAAFTIDPLTVTTLDDVMDLTDGKTSLREAIEYANQEGGNQTITFSNATDWLGTGSFGSGATLTLNPALGALNVTANITIDGSLVYGNGIDQGTLTITGGDAIQIFTIAAGGGMTVSNMSLTGGNAGEGNGGAINNAGTLALTNVNVSNSKAMNGGAIYNTGSLTVNGGTFCGNSVDGSDNLTGSGGAIHSTGTATISSAVFDSNSAKYNGGAIYNNGTLSIYGGVFSGHSAQNGVLFNQGNLLISGGTYTENTANVLGTWSGTALIANAEIFGNTAADTININGDGSVIIIGSTIADNDDTNVINAVSGSANVYNSILEGASAGTVKLYSSVYTSTTATADTNSILVTESAEAGSALKQIFGKEELSISGGLLPILDKALTGGIQFQVDGSDNLQYHNGTEWITIQANTLLTDAEAGRDITGANRRGAGLYTMGAYDASGLIVTTSADTVDPDDGKNSLREAIAFAVSLGGGTITFSKNVNWGTEGTTIKVTSTFNITAGMTGTLTIDGSLKYVDANGVETDYGRMTLDGGNTVTVADDGKITFGKTGKRIFKVTTAGTFTLNNLILQNAYHNSSSDADRGGAAIWQSGGVLNMDNCYIVHNTAAIGNNVGGAAVRLGNVKFHISDSKFEGNGFSSSTTNAAGGALFINGCTSADNKITNTDFLKNYADANGNGKGGGAIAIRGASVVTITGGEFTENYAIRSKGSFGGEAGAIWLDGKNSKLVIDGATFSRNHADYAGGAIKMESETILEVRNSTFTENYSVKSNGGAIAQPQGGTATITNSYFSKNEAVNGGAVYNNSGIITILNNVFTYNKATGANGAGGAVRIGNANGDNPNESRREDGAWITNSTFYGNSAAYGGAIANASSGSGNHPYFHNLTIAGNTATKKGGGFFAQHHATTSNTITNSIILGNTVGTDADDVCMVQDKANNGNHKFSISNSVIGVFRHGGFGTIDSGYSYSAKHTQHVTLSGTVYLKELWGIKADVDENGATVYVPYEMTITNQLTDADYNKIFVGNGDEEYKIYLADDGKSVLLRHAGKDILANVTKPRKEDTDQLGEAWTQYGEKYLVGAVGKLADNLSLVVTTDKDVVDAYDGLISLREAVATANANGGGTITFSKDVDWSTTDKTITLDGEDAEGNLLGALAVTSNITIDGSLMYGTVDCGTITIDGADAVQLFTIASGVAADFSNMTLSNGFVAGQGGAIYNEGTLSLTNTVFRENTAGPIGTDFIGNGGAIYNNGGTLTIADSRFENNLADGAKASHHGGGALYASNGTVTISNTIFTGNNGYTGGAIEIAGNNTTTVTISDSVFSNNVSRMWDFWGSGGAISIGSGSATLSITGTLFDGNTVTGGNNYGINGGAIAIRDTAQVFIDSSTFVNHTNGVFAVRGSYGAHMTIINSTIINNETSANGASGGIFFQETNDSYTLINSLVGNNKGFDFFSTGADNSTYSQLHHVITTGNSGYWNGGSATATLGGASLTVLSAADFKALFADGSFDADGKVVLTADGTVAISKDGAAAYAGALVGQLDGAYYYAVDGYWYSLDGTKGSALTTDAATGYGLGDTATIYTSAKNTDANGDKVSRVLTTLAFNIGSHALDTVETPSLVVNVAQDAFNPFDGKTTLREAIAEAQRNGGTVTFDQAAIAASGARTVTVGSDTYYVIDILKTANSTNNGSAFILTNNLAIDGGTNKIMLDISKSNGTSMQVGRYFEVGTKKVTLTVKNLVIRGSASAEDGSLDLGNDTKRNVDGAFYYGGSNMSSDYVLDHVVLERFNTSGKGVISLHAWHKTYNFIDSTIQDNASATYLIRLQSSGYAAKFQGVTIQRNTTGTLYEGTMSINFSVNADGGRNLISDNTFTGNMFTMYISVNDADIVGNEAKGLVAGVNKSSFALGNSTVADNTFSSTLLGATGSARWGHWATVTVEDTVFSGNTFKGKLFDITSNAQDGYVTRSGILTLSNVTFTNNTMTATTPLLSSSGEVGFNNLTFYNNTVAGDIFSINGGTFTLLNSTIAGNTSATAGKVNVVNVLSGTVTLLNNILVGNNGTSGTSAVTVADGAMVNAFYNVYDSADATLNSTNTVSTMADVFGTAPAFDGKTVAITPAGPAAIKGTLVGKIGSDVYYVADGSWFKVGSDTAAATFDAENTNNDNYGLGTATGTSVYTTAQNGMDRLAVADLGFFNVGAYAFDPAMVETASTVVDLAEDVVNPFDGKISLREAIAYAGTGTLGNEITFADAVTAVTLSQLLAIGKNITITDNDVTVNGNLSVASGSTLTVSSGSKVSLGTVSNSGTIDNKGTLTLAALESTGNLTNSGMLDVNGNFAGGTVTNTGSMTLAGANNSGTGTLGNVTYDGADQQVIAGTYGNLTINSTGKATATGNVVASGSLTNTAELTVDGNVAAASISTSGDTEVTGSIIATGDIESTGDLTVGGSVEADNNITTSGVTKITNDLTANSGDIKSTNELTVGGDVKAADITLSGKTEVTGDILATEDLDSAAALTVGGNAEAYGDITIGAETEISGDMTAGDMIVNWTDGNLSVGGSAEAQQLVNYGEMEVTGDVTLSSDIVAYAKLTAYGSMKVGGDVEVESVANFDALEIAGDLTATDNIYNSKKLTVGGDYSAASTDNGETLTVGGNFSGGAVNNTGAMTLSGASNTANAGSTLGDVTYNGTTDQQVIAGTYEDLVISTTGKATVNGDVSAATVKSDADTAITGDLTATGNITSNGDMDVIGNLTATGDLASTAALTVGGNASANNATLSGDTAITGDLTATGTVDSDAALTVGGNLTADTADNSSDLTVGGTFTATTTNNSGTLDAEGDLNAGALTNSGSISVAGAFATTGTDLGAVEYDGTAAQNVVEGTYSDLSLTGGDKSLAGAVTVTDSLTADANIDTAGQDLTLSGDIAGTGTISTTTDSGTVTYDGADQNVLAGAYNNLALTNGTKTLSSANTTTVNDTFSANNTTIQSDAADILASLTVKDAGNDNAPSSAIAGTNFNGIAITNTGSADGYLYVNADTNNADDATTGVYLVGNVFVAAEGIIYGDTLGEVYITVTNGNGDVISEGTADDLGWTWAVGNDAIENATTGTAYELISKEGFKFRFHGDVDVVIGKRAITVKADDLEIDTGDDPVFTYTYVGELVGTDTFTGELASEGDGSKPGDFEITQGTLTLGDNYNITFIGGVLTVEGGGQDAHQFPNYNNPGNFAGVYDAPVHSMIHSYNHHESVPTLEHQNDRSIGFLFSVSNKQLGDASGAFGDNAPQGADVNIHAHTLSNLLKSYDKSEQIIASPANEIEDAKDDMKDLHDFSNNPFGILPDDEDLHTRAYDESIDFTVIGEDNLSTAKAEQFKDEFDAALEELLSFV